MKGWLEWAPDKDGLREKRYCEIKNSVFSTFLDEDKTELRSRLPLSQIVNVICVSRVEPYQFEIICCRKIKQIFFTKSNQETQQWILALLEEPETQTISIDQFAFLKLLGRGACGRVCLVRKKDTGELFALKSIPKSTFESEGTAHGVMVERNILMRTHFPFIVHLSFAFQTETEFHLGLEYVPGGDLASCFANPSIVFTEYQVRLYIAEITLGLVHLHDIGIVYRDLKPENILLDSEGHLKLTDFGLSRELSDILVGKRTLCGTCEFLAPEMIKNRTYGYGVDWWALGVIAYRFYCDELPFYDENRKKLFAKIVEDEIEFPSDVILTPEARSLITGLLQKNPELRTGCQLDHGQDIKDHPYFNGFDWDALSQKRLPTDFKPTIEPPPEIEQPGLAFREVCEKEACTCGKFSNFSFISDY